MPKRKNKNKNQRKRKTKADGLTGSPHTGTSGFESSIAETRVIKEVSPHASMSKQTEDMLKTSDSAANINQTTGQDLVSQNHDFHKRHLEPFSNPPVTAKINRDPDFKEEYKPEFPNESASQPIAEQAKNNVDETQKGTTISAPRIIDAKDETVPSSTVKGSTVHTDTLSATTGKAAVLSGENNKPTSQTCFCRIQ